MKKPNGYVIYEGPSMLDGAPIVAIATMSTNNPKTGDVAQTWILRADMSPLVALDVKADASICGGCPQRRSIGGACYVNVGQAPMAVWKAYKRGSYSHEWNPSTFAGRKVRLGAYGDPAAIPADVWGSVLERAESWTGYTHQIAHANFQHELLKWVMVSADTPKQAAAHQSHGRRTFRVKTADAPMLPGEVECLAESKGLSCADCGLCNGARRDGASVVINVHGSLSSRYVAKYGHVNLIAAA
ncbi:TPA: hypothetical protein N2A14_002568 [Pseudomonas aeruginosa]|nr:hypothetical protein [Pseudomonas aeruginosa]